MAVLDTLTILIEADRTGLTSQLQTASNNITQFVSTMNRQEVDWTQILSKSITPSLIATIAATFALGVTQALAYQQALQTSSTQAAGSVGSNTAAMSDSVIATSDATGQSAVDIANALGQIQQIYKDTADAQQVMDAMAKQATITGQSMGDTVAMLMPLFQNWGESASNVGEDINVMDGFVQLGHLNIDTLSKSMTEAGPAMKAAGDNIQDVAGQLEEISDVKGMTNDTVVSVFDAITKAITNTKDPLNFFVGGVGKIKEDVTDGGIPLAFQDIVNHIKLAGSNADILASGFGLTADQVLVLQQTSSSAFSGITKNVKDTIPTLGTLDDRLNANLTDIDRMKIAWANFSNAIMTFFMPTVFDDITSTFNGIADAIKGANSLVTDFGGSMKALASGDFWKSLGSNLLDVTSKISNTLTFGLTGALGGAIGNALGGAAFEGGQNGGSTALNALVNAANALASATPNPNTNANTNSSTNNSSNQYNNTKANITINQPTGSTVQTAKAVQSALYAASQN